MLSTKKFINQNSFDESFPSDNSGLQRIPYINIFQDSRSQWLTIRHVDYVMLRSNFILNVTGISSDKAKSQEPCISN